MVILFLLIFIRFVTVSNEQKFNVKIERESNEKFIREFSIIFNEINKTAGKHKESKFVCSNEHFPNKILDSNLNHNKINYNTAILPFIHRHRKHGELKNALDRFAMTRRKSHMPTVNYEFMNPINKREIDFEKENLMRGNLNKVSRESYNAFQNPELEAEMMKQKLLIDKLNRLLVEEKKALRSDFKNLMADMERLKNETTTEKQIVILPKTKPNTIVNIDEVSIRKALEGDPFVKRVLKMAKNKRLAYEKEAKNFVKD